MTLLPTLNRLTLLKQFLNSAVEANTTTPGLILVDFQDYENNKLAYEDLRKFFPNNNWAYYFTQSIKMGDKIREVWPVLKELNVEWVNVLNDDHYIVTKEWDKKLRAKLNGYNFVTCNDNWNTPLKAAGATVFSMELLETLDIPIYPPGMQHLFIDDFWETIGRATGCWDIDMSVLIEHRHALKGQSPQDDTFRSTYGTGQDLTKSEVWQNDQKVCHLYLKENLSTIVNRIRELKGLFPISYHS